MNSIYYCDCFEELSEISVQELNGGVSLQTYELVVLGVTTTAGIVVSAFNPIVGAGLIMTGWGMCMQAEEYGRSQQ